MYLDEHTRSLHLLQHNPWVTQHPWLFPGTFLPSFCARCGRPQQAVDLSGRAVSASHCLCCPGIGAPTERNIMHQGRVGSTLGLVWSSWSWNLTKSIAKLLCVCSYLSKHFLCWFVLLKNEKNLKPKMPHPNPDLDPISIYQSRRSWMRIQYASGSTTLFLTQHIILLSH